VKKVNIILNETTIINIPFIWKLAFRYKFMAIAIPLIIFTAASLKYLSQHPISFVSIGFKNAADSSNSAQSAIFAVLGEKTGALDITEIISIGNSVDFKLQLADRIYSHPDFKKFNYNPLNVKEIKSHDEIFGKCLERKECILNILKNRLGTFYGVLENNTVVNRFNLVVRTLDPLTSEVIARKIAELIEEERLGSIKYFLSEQIKISSDLVEKQEEIMKERKITNLIENIKNVRFKLIDVNRELHYYRDSFAKSKNKLTMSETLVNQSKKVIENSSKGDKQKFAKASYLRERIGQLREDIASLQIQKNFSSRDQGVIKQLKNDLRSKSRELASLGNVASKADGDFVNQKAGTSRSGEFNATVLRKHAVKAKKQYSDIAKKRDGLLLEQNEYESKMAEYKPEMEYMALIETKLVQLKLAESTVVTDLVFDKSFNGRSIYREITKFKIFSLAFLMSFVILLFVLVLRYILDDKIYDEAELRNNFQDLDIIGNTPDFT
jgi:hypothetical protein